MVRSDSLGLGEVGFGEVWQVWLGMARHGRFWLGRFWLGMAGTVRYGSFLVRLVLVGIGRYG